MSNPFMALDLSDDENIEVVKTAATQVEQPKRQHALSRHINQKTHQPRKELTKEEEDLKQKKKGAPGQRGSVAQPEVAHPGERSKIGLKKEEHVDTHKQAAPRHGRQFDRHSGTGRGKEIKKGGAGGHNWGKAGEEVNPAPAATPEPTGEKEPEEAAPVVEEDPTLTLDEYEKQKALKRSGEAFAEKAPRKVTAEISGKVYQKNDEDGEGDYIKLGGDEHDMKKKPGHFKHKEKKVFEVDFRVKDTTAEPPRRPRPEGGRGERPEGGRGERPFRPREEGGNFKPRTGGAPRDRVRAGPSGAGRLDTADQSAFPKLGEA